MIGPKTRLSIGCLVILLILILAGCGGGQSGGSDKATDIMAWQFAQGLVRRRIPSPGRAIFPRYSKEFVNKKDDNTFVITSTVDTFTEQNEAVTYSFTIEARYQGKDVFVDTSIKLTKN